MANPYNQFISIQQKGFRLVIQRPHVSDIKYCMYSVWGTSHWESGSEKIGRNKEKALTNKIKRKMKLELRKRKFRMEYCR